MDHFIWSQNAGSQSGEETVHSQSSVSLYNLEQQTGFTGGQLVLTSHRLLWQSNHFKIETELKRVLSAELKQVQKQGNNDNSSRSMRPMTVSRIFVSFDPKDHQTSHLSVLDPGRLQSSLSLYKSLCKNQNL